MNDFRVLLQAVLDSSGIGKSDIAEVQKVLNKYHLNLAADLNKSELIKTVKQIVPEIEAELKKITGIDIKINETDLLKAINQVEKDSIKAAKAVEKIASESQRLSKTNTIKTWADNNSKAMKEFGGRIDGIITKMSTIDLPDTEFKKLNAEFEKIKISARDMNLLGKTWGDSFKEMGSKFTSWITVSGGIMTAISGLRKMKDAVIEIDTAMTNLYKVTDETDSKYSSFFKKASSDAQNLGRSISSLITQTAEWAKLGYSLDTSSELAKVSSIYANVGEVDDKTAVSDLVTTMKALNIESSKSINIVNELNNLSNKYAVSASGLGEGLKNSASALALQGNSLEQILALLTGGGEITQNVGELGNMLKVASLRLASMKGKLEEIGEDYEDITSVSKTQTQIFNLTNGQVDILDEQNNKLKDTYSILEEVAGAWDDVNDLDKSELLELMFGKQRANQGAAVISAFKSGQVQKALKDAMTSDNSAYTEQAKWLDSIEAKVGQNQAAFQSLSSTVLNSDLIKFVVDFGTAVTNATDGVIKFVGSFGTLAAGTGIAAFVKNYAWV